MKLGNIVKVKENKNFLKDIIESEKFLEKPIIVTTNSIRKDFHGMTLKETKIWLFDNVYGYVLSGYKKFEFIHGYRHGTKLHN